MSKIALYVPLEAKPGKEKEVAEFLKSALPLVEDEPGTVTWFAIQEGPSSFAIFDTFDDEAGRDAHLNGKVAAALMAKAGELLAKPPAIHKIAILASRQAAFSKSAINSAPLPHWKTDGPQRIFARWPRDTDRACLK
jgi:quinol monooxygenase YgiN